MKRKDDSEGKPIHEYDGIIELDNNLPKWWLGTFYITIIVAIVYVLYYHFGDGVLIDQEFEQDVRAIEIKMANAKTENTLNIKRLEEGSKDSAVIGIGKTTFAVRCISCHGDHAQGNIGPNLTDNYWINGDGTLPSIATIIRDGVPAKGMPPWGPVVTEDELYALAAYVKSVNGSKPESAKAPQGNLIEH